MADFPRTAEPWLPSQSLLNQVPFRHTHRPCMGHHHLSQSFASLPFFPHSNHNVIGAPPNFSPELEGFIPVAGYGSINCPPTTPSHEYRPFVYRCLTPATAQPKSQQIHLLPSLPSVFGPVRRGTGVFHPRVITEIPRNITQKNHTPMKKRGRRNNNEAVEVVTPQGSIHSSKQEECPQHLALPHEWTY